MKKILITFLTLLSFSFIGCDSKEKAAKDEFVIKGKVTNFENQHVYLSELTPKEIAPLDSSAIDENGEFVFRHKINEPGFYLLKIGTKETNRNVVTLLPAQGEEIDFTADVSDVFETYKVKGSEGSEKIWQLEKHKAKQYERVDSLRVVFQNKQHNPDFVKEKVKLDSIYYAILNGRKAYVESFIAENNTSLVSLLGLYEIFGQQPLFNANDNHELFKTVADTLIHYFPTSVHAQDLKKRVTQFEKEKLRQQEAAAKLEIGKVAPEIKLSNPQGEEVALSSLRGKYVLVDFWAGWCGPCRQENPKLRNVYYKYKNRGFEIYAVSLDKDEKSWTDAIKNDRLPWIQVSDLKFWQSPVAQLYNVQAIPFNILLDKEGKIIAKQLRSEQLDQKLKEIL